MPFHEGAPIAFIQIIEITTTHPGRDYGSEGLAALGLALQRP